jgi:hypothetical protein
LIEYIGIPYSFRDYNCWHHAVKVRLDNGIKTKSFRPRNIGNAFKLITAQMQQLDHGLTQADTPEDYDIVISSRGRSGMVEHHCGIYFEGSVSHCNRAKGQVVHEPLSVFLNDYGAVKFWR